MRNGKTVAQRLGALGFDVKRDHDELFHDVLDQLTTSRALMAEEAAQLIERKAARDAADARGEQHICDDECGRGGTDPWPGKEHTPINPALQIRALAPLAPGLVAVPVETLEEAVFCMENPSIHGSLRISRARAALSALLPVKTP